MENARLFRETQEALERQTAMAEILKVIASSPSDVQPVFDAIARSAAELCEGTNGAVFLLRDGRIHFGGGHGLSPQQLAIAPQIYPSPLNRGLITGRAILDRAVAHIPDLAADPEYTAEAIVRAGFRSAVSVPMLRNGEPFGAINVTREEARPFSGPQIELLKAFADQAVIAIENARLFNETQEALEQQKASADVLGAISKSVSDASPVFEEILNACHRLFGSEEMGVYTIDEDRMVRVAAWRGPRALEVQHDVTPLEDSITGRILRERRPHHIPDLIAEPNLSPMVRERAERLGSATLLYAPMLWEDRGLGSILVVRSPPRPFSEREISLLQTFADQAAIAIENARLVNETQEALAQQTATADVLKVISRSVFDLQAVFETLLTTAVELVGGVGGAIALREGDRLRFKAGASPQGNVRPEFVGRLVEIDRSLVAARAVLSGEIEYIPNSALDPEFRSIGFGAWGKSYLGIPLSRDGRAEGALTIIASRSNAFTPRHIELIQTFADQAVIAIENVRLFDEVQARTRDLQESLEYQTAISNVLQVISRSPSDVEPVLDAIVGTARTLCHAERAVVWKIEGDEFRPIAFSGMNNEVIEEIASHRLPTGDGSVAGQAAKSGKAIQILDAANDASVSEKQRAMARAGGIASILAVPLVVDGRSTGCLTLSRTSVRAFSPRECSLMETFADQAVIAVNNARLFEEVQARTRDLEESLAQQTATANVLQVISRSAFDLQKVLDTLITSAVTLCGADNGLIYMQRERPSISGRITIRISNRASSRNCGASRSGPGTARQARACC